MKMRASELNSAAVLPDGSMSIGFRSATDSHTLELSRKSQEQLLPALLASEPANLKSSSRQPTFKPKRWLKVCCSPSRFAAALPFEFSCRKQAVIGFWRC